MMKKMIMALCIFICVFTLVACSGQQTNEPLTLGVNAIITEIDKENKIITTKDSGEEGVLGDDCLIDCSQIPMIYCNYDTQDVVDITLDDLQVGDEIILTIRSSEIENHQKEDKHAACWAHSCQRQVGRKVPHHRDAEIRPFLPVKNWT